MRYLSGYERTQPIAGMGYLGEIRQGMDGNLYEWVQGVDGLGNPIGFWKKWARRALRSKWTKRLLRRALPVVQRVASAIPLPQTQAVAAGIRAATPLLQRTGIAGYDGLGELYQAPDGRMYQLQGWGETDDLRGFAEDDLRGFEEADDLRGLGELYQAPDGTLYRVQGLAEADDLHGFAEDELRGLDEPDDLRGFAEDELRGFEEADDLRGFAEDDLRGFDEDDLRGFEEGDDLRGFAEDDLRGFEEADDLRGLDAYVSDKPAGTRWFTPSAQTPEMWRTLW